MIKRKDYISGTLSMHESKKKENKTFAIAIDAHNSFYHTEILNGISDYAASNGINLLIFVTGPINSPNKYDYNRNILFSLMNHTVFDGIIVFGSVSNFIYPAEFKDFLKRNFKLPVVCVGTELEGIPSVICDNENGISRLLVHLIKEHKFSKPALFKGPEKAYNANDRFYLCIQALKEFKINVNSQRIVNNVFGVTAGIEGVRTLMDKRKVDFDLIIAPNDDTALGAITELSSRGISVPGEIAVVGFDNIILGKYSYPGLTTVDQNLYEQGRLGCELLHRWTNGEKIPFKNSLQSTAIIRESCGCPLKVTIPLSRKETEHISKTPSVEPVIADIKALIVNLNWFRSLHINFESLVREIHKALWDEIGEKETGFLNKWEKFIAAMDNTGCKKEVILEILFILRNYTMSQLENAEDLYKTGNLFFAALGIFENVLWGSEILKKTMQVGKASDLRVMSDLMHTAKSIPEQMATILRFLPYMDINKCFINLFENTEAPAEKAILIFAYANNKNLLQDTKPVSFPATNLLPETGWLDLNGKSILIVESLFYGSETLGYIILNHDLWEYNIYELFRSAVSSALKGTLLIEKIKSQAVTLEDLVAARKSILTKSNTQLQKEVKILQDILTEHVKTEKHGLYQDLRITKVLRYIEEHYNQDLSLEKLSNLVALEGTYLSRIFKKNVGKGLTEYIQSIRLQKALLLLRNPELKIREIASMVGYPDPNYFYKVIRKSLKCSPSEYRKKKYGFTDME
ncbi:MAG: substrate-binding domain-containing protein [Spirochaetales bacterium]|nr:substrate-binding domain-containing protein [Spirochaetales bacterium]